MTLVQGRLDTVLHGDIIRVFVTKIVIIVKL